MITLTTNERRVLNTLLQLERDGEGITFTAIGEAAGLDQRALSAAWASLLVKGHVEMRPALTNAGLSRVTTAMGRAA